MMKRVLLLLLFPFALSAQTPAPFYLQLNDTIRFIALGDSYTIGQSVAATDRWPAQLKDSLVSRGITTTSLDIIATTGWRTDDLISAITGQHLTTKHYNLVSLLIGVNNQYQGRPFSQYVTEFPQLLDSAILYAGGNAGHVFVVSIPDYAYTPFGQQSANPSQISSELAQYNQYAKHVADSMHVQYFNITPISQQGLQNPAYVASDGLHPSGAQYAQWVKLMLSYIDDQIVLTGLQENKNNPVLTISPNPTTDYVEVRLQDNKNTAFSTVELYNITGQMIKKQVMSGQACVIDITMLPEGLYTLKVSSGNYSVTKKLVKFQQ